MNLHWIVAEIETLMHERKLTVNQLSSISGVSKTQIYNFFSCISLPRITTAEQLLKALGHELEIVSDGSASPTSDCPHCDSRVIPLRIKNSLQCPKCHAILKETPT